MRGSSRELEETAALMEAAFDGFARVLGSKPRVERGSKPIVRFFPDKRAWRAGLDLEQEVPPPRVDYVHFSQERRTVYVYGDPQTHWGRKWLLYGLFQEFHWTLKAKNRYLDREWYITGLADALSTHTWDGKNLKLGAHLVLPENNRGHAALQRGALARIEDGDITLEDLGDWDVRWALTGFLVFGKEGRYAEKFERLALGSRGSMTAGVDLLPMMGDPARITAEVVGWIRTQARTLEPSAGDWDEDGPALRGRAGKGEYAFAVAEPETGTMTCRVSPDGKTRAGLLLDWIDPDHFLIATIAGRTLSVESYDGGDSILEGSFAVKPDRDGRYELGVEREGRVVRLILGGRRSIELPVESRRLGLVVAGGGAVFDELDWE